MSVLTNTLRRPLPTRLFIVLALTILVLVSTTHSASATSGTLVITSNTTLTEDHFGSIFVIADNITLNCNNHAVIGPGNGFGIVISNRIGITVRNCLVTRFDVGIGLISSSLTLLYNNTANDENSVGILLSSSSFNILTANKAHGDGFPTFGSGFQILSSSHDNVLLGNAANDNHEGFFVGQSFDNTFVGNTANGNGVFTGGGGFILQQSSSNVLVRNVANNNLIGFFIGNDPSFPSNSNIFIINQACGNVFFDAIQGSTSTSNIFVRNSFCRTAGI